MVVNVTAGLMWSLATMQAAGSVIKAVNQQQPEAIRACRARNITQQGAVS